MRILKVKDKINERHSANTATSQTPLTSKKYGSTAIPIIKNINVLNNDKSPDTLPFENAVTIPHVKILIPHNKKLNEINNRSDFDVTLLFEKSDV